MEGERGMRRTGFGSMGSGLAFCAAAVAGVLALSALGGSAAVATVVSPSFDRPVGVIGKSGINWDTKPSTYSGNWGGSSGARSNSDKFTDPVWTLNWFKNNGSVINGKQVNTGDLIITRMAVDKTGYFGKLDTSNCTFPMVIPFGSYGACEISYTGDTRDTGKGVGAFGNMEGTFYGKNDRYNDLDFDGAIYTRGAYAPSDNGGTSKPPAVKGPFWDVPATHKFVKPITWMKSTGLTTGNADGSYRPAQGLTREAMAAFLYRQAGKPAFTMPETGFTDVRPGHKFYREIMWMKATRLSTGHADGTYRPSATLTREAMAAFLYRQAGKPQASTSKPDFWDVNRGHKFYREITWMRAAGITTGNADGSYRPAQPVTREAMAAFLYRQAGSPKP